MLYVDTVHHVHSAADCLVHFCSELLYHICHFLPQLLLKRSEVCWGDHVCSLNSAGAAAVAAAATAVSCLASGVRLSASHSWRRSPVLRYHVKCNSIVWQTIRANASALEEVIKCSTDKAGRQVKANVQECNGVKSVYTQKHSPSAWLGFAPKLTVTLTVAGTKLCTWILRPALMGDLTAQLEALQMSFRCGVSVTGLHAHVIFLAKSKPSTASVPCF